MSLGPAVRDPHPCLTSRCGHGPSDHLPTPELAGPRETVVWCVRCRRHETHRPSRWGLLFDRGGSGRPGARLGRAS